MSKIFNKEMQDITDEEVWKIFASCRKELKNRGLVRTSNIVGERGEFLAIETYRKISNLPKLQAAPEGTQNVDALSRKGERYSIKIMTEPSRTTGVFYGCGNQGDKYPPEKKFEYVILVIIDDDLNLKRIFEIDWDKFLKFRKWHKTMMAWNLTITQNLIDESKIIFK